MVKRIALVFLLLVATALIARVWADQGCPDCGQAWSDATGEQTGAGQASAPANAALVNLSQVLQAISACYANHGGAISESAYWSHINNGDVKAFQALSARDAGNQYFQNGDGYMTLGDNACNSNCSAAAAYYASAKTQYDAASSCYGVSEGFSGEARCYYDEAIWELVGEIDGHWCGCTFP